ncbi:MAG: FAD-dependent oxidoreductase [Porticoccaceae bacterium]
MAVTDAKGVVIIGANLAGGRAAEALRTAGYEGAITLIGDETELPYERPPLSKEVLTEPDTLPAQFYILDEAYYAENNIDLRLGVRAERLDTVGQKVELSDGTEVAFEQVILATGARVRRLNIEGSDLKGIHYLRTLEDARALSEELKPGVRIGFIGMGVIGAEVAASARKRGCEVITIEPLEIPMARALGPRFGAWLAQVHREEGVDVRLGCGVSSILGEQGRVNGVILNDGEQVDLDALVVGIGVIPNLELAEAAGLEIDNGIVVNEFAQTSNPAIYAVGDVANSPLYFGGRGRCETYQNAQDQAIFAARAIAGQPEPYLKPQWFWTDQFDINIQVLGDVISDAEVVIRGDENSRQFSAFFVQDNLVRGLLTVNQAKDMGAGRRLLEREIQVDKVALADVNTDLRQLLKK